MYDTIVKNIGLWNDTFSVYSANMPKKSIVFLLIFLCYFTLVYSIYILFTIYNLALILKNHLNEYSKFKNHINEYSNRLRIKISDLQERNDKLENDFQEIKKNNEET